jgi:non-ribosomal peptide synthase protein (TIGR01720 family)
LRSEHQTQSRSLRSEHQTQSRSLRSEHRAQSAGTPLPVDGAGPNLAASRRSLSVSLGAAQTAALVRGAPATFRTKVSDVLLAGLAWTLSSWTGDGRTLVDLEGHGREDLFDDVDLSRTVGWFTAMYPVRLEVPAGGTPDWPSVVRSVRRQLRTVPGNGLSHDALRYLRSQPGADADVVFNYHGNVSGMMTTEGSPLYHTFHEPVGQEQDPGEHVAHLLEVVGAERDGQLSFDWYYSADVHDSATVERVAGEFLDALAAIAAHCGGTS